jgi:NADH:ubiquinone oxidoreductase subunit H
MLNYFWYYLEIFSISLSVILPLFLVIAFFTLLERKVMGSLQRRIGPNIHGYYGALQPLIDGLKLLWKEMLIPAKANFYIFLFSPLFMMSLSFSLWAILPLSFAFTVFDSKLSLITFFVISSINVYNIILAGWSSNSKYAFYGSVRAMAQMFSYELILGFVLIFMMLTVGSLRIYDIMIKQYYTGYLLWPLLPFAIIFFIALLMETNRAPFDLPEAESELVAGYNVEYSSIMFAMFFLGEYCNILSMSGIWSALFWGGSIANYFGVGVFIIKILTISFIFVFIRSLLPRYRLDQLIYVGWHTMLPVTLGVFFILTCFAALFNILPISATYFSVTPGVSADRVEQIATDYWKNSPVSSSEKSKLLRDALEIDYRNTESKGLSFGEILPFHIAMLDDKEYRLFMIMALTDLWSLDLPKEERLELIAEIQMMRFKRDITVLLAEFMNNPESTERSYCEVVGRSIDTNFPNLCTTIVRDFSDFYSPMPVTIEGAVSMYANNRIHLLDIVKKHPWMISPESLLRVNAIANENLSARLLDDLSEKTRSELIHSRDLERVKQFEKYCSDLDKVLSKPVFNKNLKN